MKYIIRFFKVNIAMLVFLCVAYPLFILSAIIGALAFIFVYPIKYIICGDGDESFDYAGNLIDIIMETLSLKIFDWCERILK